MGLIDIIKHLSTAVSSAVNKSQLHPENQSRGCWVRSKYATSMLCIVRVLVDWNYIFGEFQMPPDQEMDPEVQRRLGDLQLDLCQHEGVPQVLHLHREERRLQPHGEELPAFGFARDIDQRPQAF